MNAWFTIQEQVANNCVCVKLKDNVHALVRIQSNNSICVKHPQYQDFNPLPFPLSPLENNTISKLKGLFKLVMGPRV